MKVVQASVNQLVPGMLLSMGVGLLCKKFNYFSLKNLALTRLDLSWNAIYYFFQCEIQKIANRKLK